MKTFFILFSRDHIADESMPPREVKVKTKKKLKLKKLSFWFQYLIFFQTETGPKRDLWKRAKYKVHSIVNVSKGTK